MQITKTEFELRDFIVRTRGYLVDFKVRAKARLQKQLGPSLELHQMFSPFKISAPLSPSMLANSYFFSPFSQAFSTYPTHMVENLVTNSSQI